MKRITENTLVQTLPWFKIWFDSAYYHKLYAHRSKEEAADFVDALIAELQPRKDAVMLDVGCGNGRHCIHLASKGFTVTGIDLALSSIRQAKKYETSLLWFFQHDMQLPFGHNCFDYVFNFFTSFGYFKNVNAHNNVLSNMSNALKQGGKLLLDYMNIYYAEDRLIGKEEKEMDGIIYHITRWMDEKYFFKKIVIEDFRSGGPLEYTEQVARFDLDDFKRMFSAYNLQIEEVYGDYKLNEFDQRNSPRLIMVAKKVGR
ncbi:MAG: class I SAM-dependent methyltransferase [Bacteroidota bacterium]|nr:class I SAM-dependent methyltransferase [Bacteroidota bacterium]